MLSITVWTGTRRISLHLAFVLTSSWITLSSLIPIFLRQSWKYLSCSTIAIKLEQALWPLMQLHVTTFTYSTAQTSSLTYIVLIGLCSLLVPMQSAKEQACPPLHFFPFFLLCLFLSFLPSCLPAFFFFLSHLGWEVLFYIPGLIPPMWMWLCGNWLCY